MFRFVALCTIWALPTLIGFAQMTEEPFSVTMSDGIVLKGQYFNPGNPGPAAVLFHQCDGEGRAPWYPVARALVADGFHVLTYDVRGHGESGGNNPPFDRNQSLDARWGTQWVRDRDAVLGYFFARPNVDANHLVIAGASCGVYMAARLAEDRPEHVQRLVLLSGPLDESQFAFLSDRADMPVLAAADPEDWSVDLMREAVSVSASSHSQVAILPYAGHGTDMFANEPGFVERVSDFLGASFISEQTGVDVERLRTHVDVLAADALQGRRTGTPGQKMAAAYLAATFEEYGLTAPVDGYMQAVPFTRTTWQDFSLTVGNRTYPNLSDIILWEGASQDIDSEMPLVFVGTGSEEVLHALDVRGKGVVALTASGRAVWREAAAAAKARGAEAFFVANAPSDDVFDTMFIPNATALTAEGNISLVDGSSPEILSFFVAQRFVSDVFNTSFERLQEIAETENVAAIQGIQSPVARLEGAVTVEQLVSENVVAMVPGAGALAQEYVVVSGHYDHLGMADGQVFNGANDNGSGMAAILEMARQLASERTASQRSLLFVGFTGEELGLLGSEYYAHHPIVPYAQTIANLNIDMVGRSDSTYADGTPYVYLIGSDKLSTDLHQWSEAVNASTMQLTLDYTYNDEEHPSQYYYRSDHWNFAQYGVPVIFYHDGNESHYHVPQDDAVSLDYALLAKRTTLILHTTRHLRDAEQRPRIDR